MNESILNLLNGLVFAGAQHHGGMTVIPVRHRAPAGPAYVGLRQALNDKTMKIVEKDGGGSVPELVVVNQGKTAVLILDGEELRGAKQNRVLNTSILVEPGMSVVVPVSCVEAGRWRAQTKYFDDSDQILSARARSGKSHRVSDNLRRCGQFDGDQGAVWGDVGVLLEKSGADSETSAMADAFEQQRRRLDGSLEAFPFVDGQAGLLVVVDGRVAGLDVLSRPEVYAVLHEKLVRSHAIETCAPRGGKFGATSEAADPVAVATAFLDDARQAREEVFPSHGSGQDHRLRAIDAAGSALVVEHAALHLALFPRDGDGGHRPRPEYRGFIDDRSCDDWKLF